MVVVEEPKEPMLPGCNAACAVSQAVAIAAAKLAKVQPFEHVARLCSTEVGICHISCALFKLSVKIHVLISLNFLIIH